ncbi:MAG: PilZ domain-containing protein [Candidatus Acidiferrales bacterium]
MERRAARRFTLNLPLQLRYESEGSLFEKAAQTRDVSFRGMYFMSESPMALGHSIECVLTLPQQITQAGNVHIRCFARILRCEEQVAGHGIAARIERYEFLPGPA